MQPSCGWLLPCGMGSQPAGGCRMRWRGAQELHSQLEERVNARLQANTPTSARTEAASDTAHPKPSTACVLPSRSRSGVGPARLAQPQSRVRPKRRCWPRLLPLPAGTAWQPSAALTPQRGAPSGPERQLCVGSSSFVPREAACRCRRWPCAIHHETAELIERKAQVRIKTRVHTMTSPSRTLLKLQTGN